MSLIARFKNKLLLSIAFGALVFLGFSIYADLGTLKETLWRFPWSYFLLALLLACLNYLVRFVKWHYYLGQLQIKLDKSDSLVIFLAGLIMSVTPGKLGEVLKSYLLKSQNGTPISRSAPIVLAERLTDFCSLLILISLGVFTLQYGTSVFIVILVLMLLFLGMASWKRFALAAIDFTQKLPFLRRHTAKLHTAYESTYILIAPRRMTVAVGLSLLAWFCECLGFYLVLTGLGAPITLFMATFIYAFATIAGAITMLPGGIGVTEGSMTGLLILFGVVRHQAVASTLIIRVATLWFAVLVGALVLIYNQKRFAAAEQEMEAAKSS